MIKSAKIMLKTEVFYTKLMWRLFLMRFSTNFRRRFSQFAHGAIAMVIMVGIIPAFLFTGSAGATTTNQGPRTATSTSDCVNDASIGTVAWSGPGNAATTGGGQATAVVDGTTSNYIKCTNFGFNIPTGVTIAGIVLTLSRLSSSTGNGGSKDAAIRLIKTGTIGTTDRSTATIYTTGTVNEDHGSSSDLWGTTWASSDINASNFGGAIAVTKPSAAGGAHTVSVEYATLTVYYTFNPTFEQSSYRWFNNVDASQKTFATADNGSSISPYPTEYGYSITQLNNGEYIAGGQTSPPVSGRFATSDVRFSVAGANTGYNYYGSNDASTINYKYSSAPTSDGGHVSTGIVNLGSGSGDVMLIKYDNGSPMNLTWDRVWGGAGVDIGYSVIQTSDGGYAVTGSTTSWGAGSTDMFIAKFDSAAALSWNIAWGGTGADEGRSIIQTSDGGYAVTGTTSLGGTNDAFLAKFNSTGSLTWDSTWGSASSEAAKGVKQTSDGGYVIAGETNGLGAGNYDAFIAKFDSSGTLVWDTTWGGASNDYGTGVVIDSSGAFEISGYTSTYGAGSTDAFVAKFSSSGTLVWNTTFGGTGADYAYGIVASTDGGFTIGGATQSYGVGAQNVLIAKFDATGAMANCSTLCSNPSASSSSPTATVTNPTATVTTGFTGTVSDPFQYSGFPADTETVIVAANIPGIDVGTPLNGVAQNTATTALGEQQIFRLRLLLHIGTDPAPANSGVDFKLQYAARGADNLCDTSFTNETYADVTASTPIAYANNTLAEDGQAIATNANDPTHSGHSVINQDYNEVNNANVTNTVAAGQDGMWDFALTDNYAPASTAYCFRLVTGAGATLNTYTVVPQITTLPPSFEQSNYRWYNGQNAVSNNTFIQTWGGPTADTGTSSVQTTDGGYAVTGYTNNYGAGGNDMFLAKYDAAGTLSWSKTWGGINQDRGASLIQTTDGGYAITGSTYSYGAGGSDMFIAKYDSSGTLSWSKTWGDVAGTDGGASLIQTTDGGYAVTGNTTSYGAGSTDMFIAKYDSSGTLSWSKTWGGVFSDVASNVIQTTDGGYAVTGNTTSYGAGSTDMFIAKYDSSGTLSWSKTLGGLSFDSGNSLIQTTDGGYAVTGFISNFGTGNSDMFIAKYDSSGTLSWSKIWGGTGSDNGNSLIQTTDGGYAVAGSTNSYGAGSDDVLIAKYDAAGTLSWSKIWGGASSDSGASLIQTTDGGYAVTGLTNSYGTGGSDMFLAKYDTAGNVYGCPIAVCASPSASTSSISPSTSSPSPSTSSPSPSTSSPSPSTSSPSATVSILYGTTSYASVLGGTGTESGRAIKNTTDGGYIAAGTTASYGGGGSDGYLVKYDATGAVTWNKTWGGTGTDEIRSVVQTSDGGYATTGLTNSYGSGVYDMFIAKYDSSGTLTWNKTWGGTGSDSASSVIQTTDGGYIVAGTTNSFVDVNTDMFIAKYDSSGTLSWSKTWGALGYSEEVKSVIQTSDGGYIVAGNTPGYGAGSQDGYLVKYDATGAVTWNKTWGGTGSDSASSVIQTTDGGYAIAGNTGSYGASQELFLSKFDSSGSVLWSRTVGGSATESGYSLTQASDGGYVIGGVTWTYIVGGATDAYLVKYDSSGNFLWNKTFGSTGNDDIYGVVETPDGGYASIGASGYGSGAGDLTLIKYSYDGQIVGCTTQCSTPSPTTTSPSATITSPTATVGAPSASVTTPTATITTPSATQSYNVAKAFWSESAAIPFGPLAAQDVAASSGRHDQPVRLRLTLKNVKAAAPGLASLKLQVSPKVGTCDVSFTGETYADVSGSASFNYYDNSNLTDGAWARTGAYDPSVGGSTLWYENYEESANFTNRHHIASTTYGLWDVSLTPTDNAVYGSYCFRVVNSDNSPLNAYTRVFELSIPPAANQQLRHGKFFDAATGTRQPFYW